MTNSVVVTDRIWIPDQLADRDVLRQKFERKLYNEPACRPCSNKPMRHNEVCDLCPQFLGQVNLWAKKATKSGVYFGVPSGDVDLVADYFDLDRDAIVDKRPKIKMDHKLRFTGDLYTGQMVNGLLTADQVKIVDTWISKRKGIIDASPRTGKTVIATAIATNIKMGYKTVIIADQSDLLRQFYQTFLKFTNLEQLRAKTGKRIVDVVEKLSQLDDEYLDVVLINYQKFIKDTGPERIAKYINGKYTLAVVDECHSAAATAFARFLNSLVMRYKCGLSATPTRKDNRHFISIAILGRVTVRSDVTAFLPQIEVVETNVKSRSETWIGVNAFMADSQKLADKVANAVIADFVAGHECIIIPIQYKRHMKLLKETIVEKLEEKASYLAKKGVDLPEKVVYEFWAGTKNRKTVLKEIDQKPYRVMVAIRKMVKQGIDLSRPTMLYNIVPTSNPQMFYQLSNRVCTPRENKKQPKVKMFLFNNSWSVACFKILMNREVFPKLHTQKKKGRYLMDKTNEALALKVINNQAYSKGGKVAKAKPKPSTPWGAGG